MFPPPSRGLKHDVPTTHLARKNELLLEQEERPENARRDEKGREQCRTQHLNMNTTLNRCRNGAPERRQESERRQSRHRVTVQIVADKVEGPELWAPGSLVARAAGAWSQRREKQHTARWHRELKREQQTRSPSPSRKEQCFRNEKQNPDSNQASPKASARSQEHQSFGGRVQKRPRETRTKNRASARYSQPQCKPYERRHGLIRPRHAVEAWVRSTCLD